MVEEREGREKISEEARKRDKKLGELRRGRKEEGCYMVARGVNGVGERGE